MAVLFAVFLNKLIQFEEFILRSYRSSLKHSEGLALVGQKPILFTPPFKLKSSVWNTGLLYSIAESYN